MIFCLLNLTSAMTCYCRDTIKTAEQQTAAAVSRNVNLCEDARDKEALDPATGLALCRPSFCKVLILPDYASNHWKHTDTFVGPAILQTIMLLLKPAPALPVYVTTALIDTSPAFQVMAT